MMLIKELFSRRWIIGTILVVTAVVIMVRLGIWQLDRLEQRRTFNRAVLATRDLPALDLQSPQADDLSKQTYRKAFVTGEFDEANQVVLSNQSNKDQLGVHLLTPLLIEGTNRHILVDRGWVPFDAYQDGKLDQYAVDGPVQVDGILAGTTNRIGVRSCLEDSTEANPNPAQTLAVWCVDLEAIQAHLPYEVSPLYLIREPAGTSEVPPIGTTVQIEITEGPHLGYAVQWFSFAILLAVGYPYYVIRDRKARAAKAAQKEAVPPDAEVDYNSPETGFEGSGR